jgi:hypothetical protein
MFKDFSLSIFNVENSGRIAPSPYDSIVIELEEDTPFISDFEKNVLFQTIRKEVEEALLSMKPQTFELFIRKPLCKTGERLLHLNRDRTKDKAVNPTRHNNLNT